MSKDQIIDSRCKVVGELLQDGGHTWSCTLNQTDIKTNKNKFYIIQIIKTENNHTVFIAYGRVGEKGIVSHTSFPNKESATAYFIKQFKSKTGNNWGCTFVKREGKYYLSEISYEKELEKVNVPKQVNIPESKLPPKIQNLIKLLSDVNMMQSALVHLDIDVNKMPLGKIKQSQIDKGREILTRIHELIEKGNKEQIIDLSSEYYTFIPNACGRKKPPVIETHDMVNKYRDVLDDLSNIVVSVQIQSNAASNVNPIDNIYSDINTVIREVDRNSDTWKTISDYVVNTHAPTHKFVLKLDEIFEIERIGENNKYQKYISDNKLGNKQLLIHGSRMCNWISICKNGLLLDPSRLGVYITGKMFSYGIYFSNSFSKSGQYCGLGYRETGKVCLALAEVALGRESKKVNAEPRITKERLNKEGFDSVWGCGKMTPGTSTKLDDIIVPNGKLVKTKLDSSLQYDEKIVYDMDQFRLRYLVIADMTW